MDEEIELKTVDGQTVRVSLSGAVAAVGRAIQGSAYSVSGCDGERVEVRRVRDGAREEMAWLDFEANGWRRMWDEVAKRHGDAACVCEETGDAWEYMGSATRGGALVEHRFLHRSLNGVPTSFSMPAEPDDALRAALPFAVRST